MWDSNLLNGLLHRLAALALVASWAGGSVAGVARAGDAEATATAAEAGGAAAERRLAKTARYLSSDTLEGRGLNSAGLNLAAEYIAEQFAEIGLQTRFYDDTPFQEFQVTTHATLGTDNEARLVGPPDSAIGKQGVIGEQGVAGEQEIAGEQEAAEVIELKLEQDYSPLAMGADGTFDLPLVFAGYGITAPEAEYDDFADVDVDGKAVVILRHEPQQDNPHSVFNGTEHSEHAPFRRKVSHAYQLGAAAVLFCTDQVEISANVERWQKRRDVAVEELANAQQKFSELTQPTAAEVDQYREQTTKLAAKIVEYSDRVEEEKDPVLEFRYAGTGGESRELPVLHCSRQVVDRLLTASGHPDLATIETEIDRTMEPQSFPLPSWRLQGRIEIDRQQTSVRNVVGVLEGEGPAAEETVIVSAHYDHLGRGEEGSAAPGNTEIHNGADDNASGIAVLLEIARRLSAREEPLARRVVLIAFTGEERGLLGSAEYARQPLFPLETTVAMVNFDMVGRLLDNKLMIHGTSTATAFDPLIDKLNESFGFEISRSPGGFGPSDHSTFYAREIPVLHLFTGSHADYHRPTDDFHLLNVAGMEQIGRFAERLVVALANADARPAYVAVDQQPIGDRRANPRPYFGSIPDFAATGGGYGISGVAPKSPAANGGLAAGDLIIRLGEFRIGNLEDFDSALRKFEGGDKVDVVVKRGDEQVSLEVILDPPR